MVRSHCLPLVIYVYVCQTLLFRSSMQSLVHKVLRTVVENRRSLCSLTAGYLIVSICLYLCCIVHLNSNLHRNLLLLRNIIQAVFY